MYKVLVVSNNPFYGGGESFIVSTLLPLRDYFDMCFIVRNAELVEKIRQMDPASDTQVVLMESSTLLGQRSEIRHCLQDFNPDLVIYNGGSTLFLSITFAAPSLLIRHTTDEAAGGTIRRFFYRMGLGTAFALAHHTVHVSAYAASQQHIARNRMSVIHHGAVQQAPRTTWYDGNRPLHLLYCGRIVQGKGLRLLIDAVKLLYFDGISDVELTVVGTGPLMPVLKAAATPNVHFVGFQSDVTPFYREADVCMQLSRFEAFGLSALDALHYSMPVIATQVGGLPELVKDGYNGYLVQPNLNSVVKAIRMLAKSPELVKTMGNNSYTSAQENFTLETAILKYKNLINQIIENS